LRYLFQLSSAQRSSDDESRRETPTPAGRTSSAARRLAAASALLLLPMLQGCLKRTYHVQQPQMPALVQSAAADQLVAIVNEQSDSIHSLKATITIRVSVGGATKGKVTDYTSLGGYILLRTPEMLRVLGMLPVVHTPAFDLASDGKTFTLTIPPKDEAYIGSNAMTKPSPKALENLRPQIFFDTLVLQKINPDDLVYLTSETPTHISAAAPCCRAASISTPPTARSRPRRCSARMRASATGAILRRSPSAGRSTSTRSCSRSRSCRRMCLSRITSSS
jgi:hypothetical protein